MSEHDHPQNEDQTPEQLAGASDQTDHASDGLITGRAASVRFSRNRETEIASSRARMEAANQSLADALKITYTFLQVGMLVLVVLFLFSGFQKINEGERGIAVRMGKPVRVNIEPGPHLSLPYPFGELIRVNEGAVEVALARDFMASRSGSTSDDELLNANIEEFNNSGRLNPGSQGSLITADQNIAHTQWRVNYHRSDHLKYIEHILPEQEREIIVLAVRRGVVRTMAETTIDDLLKSSAEAIAARVREVAQRSLDELETGITIDRMVLVRKNPPLYLLDRFASVQSAAQNAGKEREDALLKRDQTLNAVAGPASQLLIDMINEFERLVELGEDEQAEVLLSKIDTVMAGGETEFMGEPTGVLVSGEVAEILKGAQAQASTRVSRAIADLEQFHAKQAQFEANPALMVARDWSSAMAAFLNRDFVTTMYLPEGRDAELLINPDPDIERERDRARKRAEALAGRQQRMKEAQQDMYKTMRGLQAEDEP